MFLRGAKGERERVRERERARERERERERSKRWSKKYMTFVFLVLCHVGYCISSEARTHVPIELGNMLQYCIFSSLSVYHRCYRWRGCALRPISHLSPVSIKTCAHFNGQPVSTTANHALSSSHSLSILLFLVGMLFPVIFVSSLSLSLSHSLSHSLSLSLSPLASCIM